MRGVERERESGWGSEGESRMREIFLDLVIMTLHFHKIMAMIYEFPSADEISIFFSHSLCARVTATLDFIFNPLRIDFTYYTILRNKGLAHSRDSGSRYQFQFTFSFRFDVTNPFCRRTHRYHEYAISLCCVCQRYVHILAD